MSDDKQKIKDQFRKIVQTDVDAMFDKPLSDSEIDQVQMQEVGAILGEMATINDLSNNTVLDTVEALDQLKTLNKSVEDLNKQINLREELDKAA